ncbi:SAVED domain-containing protein [Trichocoleus sp. FACHB-262]|uniref:SAVED domain-containing protein n=1 Tax=Trichocoleus sp. FACHB-262 TaxID=2692869 RepID=UPI001689B1C6|nr:SAVED domain-containing protein [Trichocoleus sp. FACHB-262]MBD2122162.1 SAVED domain-containing protein [Trichocoleus sp. FACHB-262]
MSQKSGRNYTARTLKILWGRAAGRCAVPECRIELYVDSTNHDPIVIIGEIAHIEASSNSGPRANKTLAKKERDDYSNLILLCQNCHARLDGQKNRNSVEQIKQLRNAHEAWVRNSLPERGKSTTGWATILLQGPHPFDLEPTIAALLPDFPSGNPLLIKVDPDKESWPSIQKRLIEQIDRLLRTDDPFDFRLAIFPLAPVSACIAVGYYLTNRPCVRLFQYHRDDYSWSWPNEAAPIINIETTGLHVSKATTAGEIAICFHLSVSITEEAIHEVLKEPLLAEIHVTVPSIGTGWLKHQDQLKKLSQVARGIFEKCFSHYPKASKWHLFYAGPAPGGVAIGQQINPTMCPPIQLYEYRHNRVPMYHPSIVLGEGKI